MHHSLFLLLFLFLLSFTRMYTHAGGADTRSFVYAGCSADSFPADSPYQYNLNSLLSSLANSAGFSPYSNFTSSVSSSPAFGLYQCRFDVSISDCETCVSSAISWLSSRCPSAASAAVQLHGCLVRYSNKDFVGHPGKEIMDNSCGPVVVASSGGDLMAMKESVFRMLKGGKGLSRVGRNGYVGGSAQCVQDQSARHCKACVKEAVADLQSHCGGAVSGEVYLGKCYAEFWSQGAPYHRPPLDKNDHASEVGKDIAIIIGIVAAVLLIILFLNHIKKSAEEKDGAGK